MTSITTHPTVPRQPGPLAAQPPARVDPALAASAAALLSALVREEPLVAVAPGLPTSTAAGRGGALDPDAGAMGVTGAAAGTWPAVAAAGEQARRRGVFGRR